MSQYSTENEKQFEVLVIDDEALVRTQLLELLKSFSTLKIIGECSNGIEAVEAIALRRPDLIFLDIEMPVLGGFDVLHALDPAEIPVVVFVTAYDQHAVRAFDVNAVDYVLKPIDEVRLALAVKRALQRIDKRQSTTGVEHAVNPAEASAMLPVPCQRILVKNKGSYHVLKTSKITWIEAADKYVRLHVGSETYLLRFTMNEIAAKLDQNEFVRIHRSVTVNLNAIKAVEPHFHGDYKIILHDDTALPLGRSYKTAFSAKFELGLGRESE